MEQWRDVINYEGLYQVSDDGRVRSLIRLLPSQTAAGVRKVKQVLRFGSNNQGRLQVALCKSGETRRYQVHRLVLEAFAGPCPDGMEGCHNDGNHLNNRINNLRWDTRLGNRLDSIQQGTIARGETAKKSRLTEQDVRDIRASDDSQRVLADRYGVSQVAIHAIRARKTWKHI